MKKLMFAISLAAAPAIIFAQDVEEEDAAAEAVEDEVTEQDVYDSFVGCSAYHIARTEIEEMSESDAAPDMAVAETFMTAAILVMPDKPEQAGVDELEKKTVAMIEETMGGDAGTKKDFADLGQVCGELKTVAQGVIDEAKAEEDDGAEFTNAV